jgi:ABC-type uncharacterized transport system substrate-binding protein
VKEPNWLDRWKRTAEIVDKVLRGTKPAAISVEQPTKFDLVINLTTAKVLDLAVPPSLLAVADEVMERDGAISSRCSAAWQPRDR